MLPFMYNSLLIYIVCFLEVFFRFTSCHMLVVLATIVAVPVIPILLTHCGVIVVTFVVAHRQYSTVLGFGITAVLIYSIPILSLDPVQVCWSEYRF